MAQEPAAPQVQAPDAPDDGLKRLMTYVFIAMAFAFALALAAVYGFTRWFGV